MVEFSYSMPFIKIIIPAICQMRRISRCNSSQKDGNQRLGRVSDFRPSHSFPGSDPQYQRKRYGRSVFDNAFYNIPYIAQAGCVGLDRIVKFEAV